MPDDELPAAPEPEVPPTGSRPDPRPDTQPTPAARLRASLSGLSRAQVVVAVLLAALGFAAVTQVRTNHNDDTYAGAREQDLIDLLNGLAGASEKSRAEIARLERTRSELQSTNSQRQAALEQSQKEADTLNVLAGLVPVTGPGVHVTIEDPDNAVTSNDLLDVVQELRTAGAEAISFNGKVRVVADTSFAEGLGGIVVSGTLLTPPYAIDVIGEKNALVEAITFPQGLSETVQDDGGAVDIESLDKVDINAIVEPEVPEYAQPDNP